MIVSTPDLSRLEVAFRHPRRTGKYLYARLSSGASPEACAFPFVEADSPSQPRCRALVGLVVDVNDGEGRVLVEFKDYGVKVYLHNVDHEKTVDLITLRDHYSKLGLHSLFCKEVLGLSRSNSDFTALVINPTVSDYLTLGLGRMLVFSPSPGPFHTQRRLIEGAATYYPDFFQILVDSSD